MARGGVGFSEVDEAARFLQGQGRNPTVDAIREQLGTGSRTTLAEHLKRWKSLQADGEGRLPQPLLALISGLWENLQSQAEQRVTEYQASSQQEISVLNEQIRVFIQTENISKRDLHQLQEKFDVEQREKLSLKSELQAVEKTRDQLDVLHQAALKQVENGKQENQRLHQLAAQIQANLEHYQQAIQQQQLEYNLAKEKQYADYAQEVSQLKTLLNETKIRHEQCEKALITIQTQLQQVELEHNQLVSRHEKVSVKNQELERELIRLQTQEKSQQKNAEEIERALSDERQLAQSLNQQVAVLSDQCQRAQNDLRQAEDKIEILRQEKMFLVQEKSQLDGVLKLLQSREKITQRA